MFGESCCEKVCSGRGVCKIGVSSVRGGCENVCSGNVALRECVPGGVSVRTCVRRGVGVRSACVRGMML